MAYRRVSKVLQLFRTRIARVLAALAVAVGLYALAGFVIAPKIARHALLEDIPKSLGVTSSVGDIHINPFLLHVEIKNFALAGKEGRLLGFGRLFVDFQLSSLWRRAYSFGRIEIADPYVNADVGPDGTLNLLQLRSKSAPPSAPTKPAKSEPLPALRVGSFKVTQGSMSYRDRSRPAEFAARLEPINFELKDFTTGLAGGVFTLTGATTQGERIEWQGHLSVQPIESDGELRIDGLRARTIWEYLEDQVNFVINSGSINVQASYKFSLQDRLDLSLNVAQASVTDLAVRARGSDEDWIDVAAMTVTGAGANLGKRTAQVDSVSLTGLKVLAWLEPNGAVNLLELTAPPPRAEKTAAQQRPTLHAETRESDALVAANGAPRASAAAPWTFDLRELELRDARISAEDRSTQPAVKAVLAPLSLKISGVSLDLSKPVKLALDTRINDTGSLAVDGELTPRPLTASLSLKLAGIDLTPAQPYIAQHTSMTLRSGKLGGEAQLRYGAKQSPAVKFAGNIYVEKLHTVDDALHDDFINWERLDIRGLNYQQTPDRLDIAEVAAHKPYARVIIESDASLNVKRVLDGPGGAPAPSAGAAAKADSPKTATATPMPSGTVTARVTATAPGAAPAMPLAIKKVSVRDGRVNFTDLSVAPNFSAGIQDLQGSVIGLSSNPNSRAKVDLHGNVDAFSPVSITGELNILSAALYTDLAMDFRNIELSIFNPYSGKFAGYNITKGKLTAQMHYKVAARQLDAQHRIIIDQLEFGDKTESKNAVSLPVKLAVALLKDRNGVIDLPLPVTGSLDDPKFRIGPIIWKVLVNILEKAVTAPFALLGSLFGGGPDLQFIDFQPGASALDASQADKIKAIVKALQERPQLKIEVPIGAVPDIDGPALVTTELRAQLSEVEMQRGGRKKADAPLPAFDQLEPPAKLEVLTQLYLKDLGQEPKYPDTVTAVKEKPELVSAKIDFLTTALREHLTVSADALTALGQQRAMTLQQALLTDTQIGPERVFLVANNKVIGKDGAVRVELSLR
jgi:hypothetical protein